MEKKTNKKEGEHVWNAFKQMKSYMEKSYILLDQATEDNYYISENGKRIYDGVSTLLNSNLGHNQQRIQDAILKQLQHLDNATMFTSTNTAALDYAKKLISATDNRYYSAFFTNSGSESCDTAIKIARKYWYNKGENRIGVISLEGCYHGSSIGAMMVSHGGYSMEDYSIPHEYFYQIPIPDPLLHPEFCNQNSLMEYCIKSAQAVIENKESCVGTLILEQVQLSNAAFELPIEYLEEIVSICRANDVLVIVDEVATGFGRMGSLFASEQSRVWGDMMMFAKGVTSGCIPMGGVLVSKKVFMNFWGEESKALENGFTTGGHPVACAAASVCLDILQEDGLCERATEMGRYLFEQIKTLKSFSFVQEVRGKGLMLALIFDKSVRISGMENWGLAEIISRFLVNKGLLLYPDSDNVIIIAPPLNVEKKHCDFIFFSIHDCLVKISQIMGKW